MGRQKYGRVLAISAAAMLLACGDAGSGDGGPETGGAGTGGLATGGTSGSQSGTGGVATGGTTACASYEQVNAQVFSMYCASCHTGNFADAGVRLDSAELAAARAQQIQVAVTNGSMPEGGPRLGSDLVGLVTNWASCL
jgi:hypothetical protein